jgi:hypothetical protein
MRSMPLEASEKKGYDPARGASGGQGESQGVPRFEAVPLASGSQADAERLDRCKDGTLSHGPERRRRSFVGYRGDAAAPSVAAEA